jgi:hypothetical protein
MSYGDKQIAAIDRSRARASERGAAAMRGMKRTAIRTFQRHPVVTTASVVVGGLATVSLVSASGRAPRSIRRLFAGAIGVLRLDGALAVLRSLGGTLAPSFIPSSTDSTARVQHRAAQSA